MQGTSADVEANAIWSVRDGLVVTAEFYAERQQAFEVAGLSRGAVAPTTRRAEQGRDRGWRPR